MDDYRERLVSCRTIHGERKEVPVKELSFRASIYGVVPKDGAILLVPHYDGYDFPGGGVHEGEPLLEALVREVKEESGIDVKPVRLLHMQDDFFIHPRSGKALHSILIFYLCEAVGGELSDAGFTAFEKEVAKIAEWVPVDTALTAKFFNPADNPALIRSALSQV